MSHLFLSHSSVNVDLIMELSRHLEERDFQCWYAPRNIEQIWQDDIVKAIKASGVFILVVTANSVASSEVERELSIACQQKIPVIPYFAEQVVPSNTMEYYFTNVQRINAYSLQPSEAWDKLSQRVRSLLSLDETLPALSRQLLSELNQLSIDNTDAGRLVVRKLLQAIRHNEGLEPQISEEPLLLASGLQLSQVQDKLTVKELLKADHSLVQQPQEIETVLSSLRRTIDWYIQKYERAAPSSLNSDSATHNSHSVTHHHFHGDNYGIIHTGIGNVNVQRGTKD